MNNISTDPGIFIRSMATRGSLGGLATSSKEVADLIDAYGFERVITETVGVGQSELEIAETADTTVVVLVPESGDSIQAMKAGLMEVADVFVINKADRPGADRLAQEIEVMLHMRLGEAQPAAAGHHGVSLKSVGKAARTALATSAEEQGGWAIPVLKTVAQSGEGLDELVATLDRHAVYLEESGELSRRRQRRMEERTRAVVERELRRLAWEAGPGEEILPTRSRRSNRVRISVHGRGADRARASRRNHSRERVMSYTIEQDVAAGRAARADRREGGGAARAPREMEAWQRRGEGAPKRQDRFTTVSGAEVDALYTPLDRPESLSRRGGLLPGAHRLPGRVPVHPRAVRYDVPHPALDDAAVRRLRHGRGDERSATTSC
jgi:LAO/AO transport system ATPase